ncbi:DNA repair protein RadC [Desulforhopalus vacuolatus]|uniref:RadC family protein n=1 Tax=Desulforhopalus vacuolatus TaxID=40414 RepID=UPI001965BF05|nr:DNA repair protein RadC [Desulforhopalus vacuolatus]MBM9519395.1 DNA repair protein RadC [Desulforhopalus vacuolatus]
MEKTDWQNKGKGHRGRLRDRFLENGLDGFSDAEVLELLLTFGTPRSDCKEPARELLKELGSFSSVLDAPLPVLEKVKGIGPKNSFALRFIHVVASHYLRDRVRGRTYLQSSAAVIDYLSHEMRGLKREIFKVIFLDTAHAIIDAETMGEGTLNRNAVYPREVIKLALDRHAAAIILAHNHPSGSLQPSAQDIKLTKTMHFLCSCMELQLLDHIIIGDGSYSFADNGLMQKVQASSSAVMDQFSDG